MRKSAIFLFMLTLLLLVACKKDEEQAVSDLLGEDDETPVVEEAKDIYPFTGIKTDDSIDNRALAVMINNQREARPQSGLSEADIVFEMLAEGNITRFLALFQSSFPKQIGPVRSAREYYFELAKDYDALYVYHGAANFVNDMIKDRKIEHLNGAYHDNDGHLFKRESFRVAPHNSYLLFDGVYEVAESKGYDTQFTYAPLPFLEDGEEVVGDQASYVKIQYYGKTSYVEFEYDQATEKYNRYNDGEQTVELDSNKPIQVDNVFIIEADHQIIDKAGRRAIDLKSGGKAYLIQKGKYQQLQWENRDGRLLPVKDGEVVPFVPGQTWVNVVQTTPPSSVTEQVQILDSKE